MPTNKAWLPLFPLNAVLFPDSLLPLRVFETRYIDMVRACMKTDAPFGIAKIRAGQETGTAADPEAVGCLAHIAHWDMQEQGVLLLRVRGGARFRIGETRVLPDQRLEAQVDMLADDSSGPVSAAHVACAASLKKVIDQINAKGRAEQGENFISPFSDQLQFDNAAWVANRWCEILPIPLKARQMLLELDDANGRLGVVHQYLQQHKIV
jgi:Lon protease-like protein